MKLSATKSVAWLVCSFAVLAGGCRRPAFQDIYVQNMAAEIRELEDIIYEYDHEYRKLELELEGAKRENEMLRKLGISSKNNGQSSRPPSDLFPPEIKIPDQVEPEKPPTAKPEPEKSLPEKSLPEKSLPEKSLLDNPKGTPPKELKEEPSSTPLKTLEAEENQPLKLEPNPSIPGNENALPDPPPSILPPPTNGTGSGQGKSNVPSLMEPPQIDLGTPTDSLPPDSMKKVPAESGKINDGKASPIQLLPPPTLGALEVELGRIAKTARTRPQTSVTNPSEFPVSDLGVSTASYTSGSVVTANAGSAASSPEPSGAPLDRRMTEIVFVRPFCVALDLDGETGDEAIRLVLQPRNAAGEFLEQPAELIVSIIDAEALDDSGRIGMWQFTPDQVAGFIRKQGQAKGIHVDISLKEKIPASKKVLVFVRYQTEDGRRVENNHQYMFSEPGDLDTKWLPRATNSSRNSSNGSG